MSNQDIITKLKKSVLAKCAERIEHAKHNPPQVQKEEHGFTSSLKKNRGL
jgi:hypothetical protein